MTKYYRNAVENKNYAVRLDSSVGASLYQGLVDKGVIIEIVTSTSHKWSDGFIKAICNVFDNKLTYKQREIFLNEIDKNPFYFENMDTYLKTLGSDYFMVIMDVFTKWLPADYLFAKGHQAGNYVFVINEQVGGLNSKLYHDIVFGTWVAVDLLDEHGYALDTIDVNVQDEIDDDYMAEIYGADELTDLVSAFG